MNEDYSLYEKIDFYLKGKLSNEERSLFEEELKQNDTLQKIVESQEIANNVILTKQLMRLQGKIRKDLKSQNRLGKSTWMGLSVSILIGLGIFWFYTNIEQDQNVENSTLKDNEITTILNSKESEHAVSINSLKKTVTQNNSLEKDIHSTNGKILSADSTATVIEKKDAPASITTVTKSISIIDHTSEIIPKIDCSLLSIEDAFSTIASCNGEQNGEIQINPSKIRGGLTPYLFSITKQPKYSKDIRFQYLNAGSYLVSVKDNNGCISQEVVEIEEKACKSSNIYVFSPDFEKWEIPFNQNKQGEIKIFNKSGILVYNSRIGDAHENTWDGKSLEGKMLDSGYFVYVLKYNDGEEERGSVTIR